jgi:drug/metabolite transporter (DMT)-like permease
VALVLAVAAALLLGLSDFFAARSARTVPSVTVTRTAVGVSVVLSPLLLFVVESKWIARDLMLGATSGLFMIAGLMLLYHGYSVARMGIVAPLSSLLIAVVPAVWDLTNSVTPSALASVGMVIGLVALVLTSYTPGGSGSAKHGTVLGVASGLAFGIAFTLMGEVSKQAGLTPVITQRLAGFVLLAVIAAVRSEPFFAPEGVGRRYALATGVPAVCAIASLQLAFQKGDAGPVAVASSQFATVAVILSVLFNRERMRWWQAVGVAATAIAVGMIAAG